MSANMPLAVAVCFGVGAVLAVGFDSGRQSAQSPQPAIVEASIEGPAEHKVAAAPVAAAEPAPIAAPEPEPKPFEPSEPLLAFESAMIEAGALPKAVLAEKAANPDRYWRVLQGQHRWMAFDFERGLPLAEAHRLSYDIAQRELAANLMYSPDAVVNRFAALDLRLTRAEAARRPGGCNRAIWPIDAPTTLFETVLSDEELVFFMLASADSRDDHRYAYASPRQVRKFLRPAIRHFAAVVTQLPRTRSGIIQVEKLTGPAAAAFCEYSIAIGRAMSRLEPRERARMYRGMLAMVAGIR